MNNNLSTKLSAIAVSLALMATAPIQAQTTGTADQTSPNAQALANFNRLSALAEGRAPRNLSEGGLRTFIDAYTTYIYGYALLAIAMTERVVTSAHDATHTFGRAPINQFYKAQQLPGSQYSDVVLPSTTTLYASAFFDFRQEPVVLHIPEIPPVADTGTQRFFIVQLLDAWTNVQRDSPSTRLHSRPGNYLLAGPKTDIPSIAASIPDLRGVIRFDTDTAWAISRFYTDGTDADINALTSALNPIPGGLTITPLSEINENYTPPSNVPVNPSIDTKTQPIDQLQSMGACEFFNTMSAMMMTNPRRRIDVLMQKPLEALGITGQQFTCANRSQDEIQILEAAVTAARDYIASIPQPSPTPSNWSMPLDVGDYGINYVLRAAVAKKALGANRAQDAVYAYTGYDSKGTSDEDVLTGAKRYVLHFKAPTAQHLPGEIPPANSKAFWSLTLYDGNGFLVKNEVATWNALGRPYVQQHKACFNADGSLDVYVQAAAPSDPKQFCNWLETPQANAATPTFILFLRVYWPDRAVLQGRWYPPPIEVE